MERAFGAAAIVRTEEAMAVRTREPAALQPALRRLDEIARLSANWDSYGALAPSPRAVTEARALIDVVVATAGADRDDAAPWTSAPIADGGVQLEWKGRDDRIEVYVAPDGALGFVIVRGGAGPARYDEEADVPMNRVVAAVVDLLRR